MDVCFPRTFSRGTPVKNVGSILRNGLDPARRSGQALGAGEYFGVDPWTSMSYCQGGDTMIVVAVLTDPVGITADTGAVLVCHKPEHQCPIFGVTFRPKPGRSHQQAMVSQSVKSLAEHAGTGNPAGVMMGGRAGQGGGGRRRGYRGRWNAPATYQQQMQASLLLQNAWKSQWHVSRSLKDPLGAQPQPQRPDCLLYTSPSPRDATLSRMPSSA